MSEIATESSLVEDKGQKQQLKAQVKDTPKEITVKMVVLGCCFGIVATYDLILPCWSGP